MRTPDDPIDAEALSVAYQIPESTIRTWAGRGLLTKYPQGHRKRTLYSLSEFARVFTANRRNVPASVDR